MKVIREPGGRSALSTVLEVTSPVSSILNERGEPGLKLNCGVAENGVQLTKTGLAIYSLVPNK
jgi:hypothetical protein